MRTFDEHDLWTSAGWLLAVLDAERGSDYDWPLPESDCAMAALGRVLS